MLYAYNAKFHGCSNTHWFPTKKGFLTFQMPMKDTMVPAAGKGGTVRVRIGVEAESLGIRKALRVFKSRASLSLAAHRECMYTT